jgi:hypothetical protein
VLLNASPADRLFKRTYESDTAMSLGQTPYQLDWTRKRIGDGCDNNRIGEVTWSYVIWVVEEIQNFSIQKLCLPMTIAHTGSVEIESSDT